jgi:hypothetical protein
LNTHISKIFQIPITTQQQKKEYKDIDELLSYINADENENKAKKIKKKNKPKKYTHNMIKNNEQSIEKNISSSNIVLGETIFSKGMKDKIEEEIQEFRTNLRNNSYPAFKIKKIKPYLSQEWMTRVSKLSE